MDIYSIQEEAYKRGYEAGKSDAVEVVRCKDCEHCRTTYTSKEHTPFHFCKKMNSTAVKLDGFCFYGERKDNETNNL